MMTIKNDTLLNPKLVDDHRRTSLKWF